MPRIAGTPSPGLRALQTAAPPKAGAALLPFILLTFLLSMVDPAFQ
jgi:hypothetical protein